MGATAASGDGAWLSYVFFVCVGVITLGLLWFRVVRPMLEDFGVIQPADDAPAVNRSANEGAHYVEEEPVVDVPAPSSVPAFERPEPVLFVPPVQLPNGLNLGQLDIARLDTLARLMAAGTVSESCKARRHLGKFYSCPGAYYREALLSLSFCSLPYGAGCSEISSILQ